MPEELMVFEWTCFCGGYVVDVLLRRFKRHVRRISVSGGHDHDESCYLPVRHFDVQPFGCQLRNSWTDRSVLFQQVVRRYGRF